MGVKGATWTEGLPAALRSAAADSPNPLFVEGISAIQATRLRQALKRSSLDVFVTVDYVSGIGALIRSINDTTKAERITRQSWRAMREVATVHHRRAVDHHDAPLRVWTPKHPGDVPDPLTIAVWPRTWGEFIRPYVEQSYIDRPIPCKPTLLPDRIIPDRIIPVVLTDKEREEREAAGLVSHPASTVRKPARVPAAMNRAALLVRLWRLHNRLLVSQGRLWRDEITRTDFGMVAAEYRRIYNDVSQTGT